MEAARRNTSMARWVHSVVIPPIARGALGYVGRVSQPIELRRVERLGNEGDINRRGFQLPGSLALIQVINALPG